MSKGVRFTEDDLRKLQARGLVITGMEPIKKPAVRKPAKAKAGDKVYGSAPLSVAQTMKPLSVNAAWKGQRFKTDLYKDYEAHLLQALPDLIPPAPPYRIYFEFGFSNRQSDWDNPCKPLQDILQKKYGFNDRDIMEAHVVKKIVAEGEDYFVVTLSSL